MSSIVTEIIGNNIKKFREESKLSQKELAEYMNMSRPIISNWENGKGEPSSSQLLKLSQQFKISTDELVGNSSNKKSVVVVDTSALIKRPSVVDELPGYFDEVIIPEVVISELNNLKDSKKNAVKQKAWLVMASIGKNTDCIIAPNVHNSGKNDEKIAGIAKQRAKHKPLDDVYLLSDDIWFQFLTREQSNLHSLTPSKYAEKFIVSDKNYDPKKSIEFLSLVEKRKIDQVMKFDLIDVDINMSGPSGGLSPLITAVRNRDLDMIDYLISHKDIDLNIKDKHKYGFSALHHATQLKDMGIIKKLIESGADYDVGSGGDNKGNTPLMVAAWGGANEALEYFISQGACTNQQDNRGFTPLMKACIKQNVGGIRKLVSITDLKIRSKENKTALDYISVDKKNSKVIVSIFKEHHRD